MNAPAYSIEDEEKSPESEAKKQFLFYEFFGILNMKDKGEEKQARVWSIPESDIR